jgi:hypothetical protein
METGGPCYRPSHAARFALGRCVFIEEVFVPGACRCRAALRRAPGCFFFHRFNWALRFFWKVFSPELDFDFAFGRQLPCSCCFLPGTGS